MEIQTKTVIFGKTPDQRKVVLEIGKEYYIRPINERNAENRGRRCILLDFVPYSPDKPEDIVARVEFCDDYRKGRVELEDLIPI
jgi:ribosome biogenesis SPOUT family RNA methylase Rps3